MCIQEKNEPKVHNFVYKETDDTIKAVRDKLSGFDLINGQKVDEFLNSESPIDLPKGIIMKAKDKVYSLFIDALASKITEGIAKEGAMRLVVKANKSAQKVILKQIDLLYNHHNQVE